MAELDVTQIRLDVDSLLDGSLTAARATNADNATNANNLKTARKLKTNLASTENTTFDGSSDTNIGVTGTLPVSNGGTGVTTDSELALKLYPIGAIYISYVSTSPAELFGGTWTQITDRFLRAANDTNTGGSDTHSLTSKQMPRHNHRVTGVMLTDAGSTKIPSGNYYAFMQGDRGSDYTGGSDTTQSASNGDSHNNMPAYQDVYVWRRTA